MTPEEKARELITLFKHCVPQCEGTGTLEEDIDDHKDASKECALTCVNEILENNSQLQKEYDEDLYTVYGIEGFWLEVKQEIEKL